MSAIRFASPTGHRVPETSARAARVGRARGWPIARCRTSRISCSACPPGARRSRSTTSSRALTVARNLDWSPATTFNLDEFLGLGPEDPGSYRRFMEEHLFRHTNLRPERINFLDGERGSRRGVRALRAGDRRGGGHRPADSRHRHQRPHRLQRAGARPGGAHPSRHAEDRDAAQQCGAVRRRVSNRCRPKRCRWGWRRFSRRGRSFCSRRGAEGAVRRARRPRPAHDRAAGVVPAAAPRCRLDPRHCGGQRADAVIQTVALFACHAAFGGSRLRFLRTACRLSRRLRRFGAFGRDTRRHDDNDVVIVNRPRGQVLASPSVPPWR